MAEWVKVFDEVNVATALHRLAKLQPPGTAGPQSPVLRAASFQLLVAVILSAQTTDKKVNEVTPALFAAAGDAAGMAALEARRQTSACPPEALRPHGPHAGLYGT